MKGRIIGLIVLALLALASLYASSFWSQQEPSPLNRVSREQAEYHMWTWLITCSVFFAAWIWLLVKTIRYRRGDVYEEYQ
jgi:hypothetical protein